ncbi:UNVERIFIED_CONTAM: hypothetical protein K2H54_030430 [Gekko kuhli]
MFYRQECHSGNTVGNKGGDIYVIHNEEGNFSISFNGSHVIYYGNEDYYYENSTFDYYLYETPVTKNFSNSAGHLLQGPLPFFFGLLHLLPALLRDIRM